MPFALVVMAAGLGSRFGGDKQLVPVGPAGEVFFDYAIRDARAVGAQRVVMIVRRALAAEVEAHVRAFHDRGLDLHLVCQDEADAPPRDKPWGTAHAILTAAGAVDRPFLVVNADDYYGTSAYRMMAAEVAALAPGEAVVAGFELTRTLPAQGSVTRGICAVRDGLLERLVETSGIERRDDGQIVSGDGRGLDPYAPVSMNMWGFPPSLFTDLEVKWAGFLDRNRDDPKAEFLLPEVVAELVGEGRLRVRVVPVDADWLGVTNPDDLEPTRAALAAQRGPGS